MPKSVFNATIKAMKGNENIFNAYRCQETNVKVTVTVLINKDITSLNNVRIKTEFKNIGMQTSSTALCIKGNNSDTFSWHFLGYSQLSVISQILVNG